MPSNMNPSEMSEMIADLTAQLESLYAEKEQAGGSFGFANGHKNGSGTSNLQQELDQAREISAQLEEQLRYLYQEKEEWERELPGMTIEAVKNMQQQLESLYRERDKTIHPEMAVTSAEKDKPQVIDGAELESRALDFNQLVKQGGVAFTNCKINIYTS